MYLLLIDRLWDIPYVGDIKASCTSKEQCSRDDIYDKHKNGGIAQSTYLEHGELAELAIVDISYHQPIWNMGN